MAPEDPTVGEVYRLVESLKVDNSADFARLDARIVEVHRRIDSLDFISRAEYRADRDALTRRVSELEDGNRWRGRMLVTSLVTAVMAPILVALVLVNVLGGTHP